MLSYPGLIIKVMPSNNFRAFVPSLYVQRFHTFSVIHSRMEGQLLDTVPPKPKVKAELRLGSEIHVVNAGKGTISEQLVTMKEESMGILKNFITKHNVPNDVPDEPLDGTSEDEIAEPERPHERPKKRK